MDIAPRSTFVIVALVIIIAALAIGAYVTTSQARLEGFIVEKPNFVATGQNLEKVEVWAIPTGTGIIEKDYILLGSMKGEGIDESQRWTMPIPADPLLVTGIFAKGYDKNGRIAGSLPLSYVGATELYQALWGNDITATTTSTSAPGVNFTGVQNFPRDL